MRSDDFDAYAWTSFHLILQRYSIKFRIVGAGSNQHSSAKISLIHQIFLEAVAGLAKTRGGELVLHLNLGSTNEFVVGIGSFILNHEASYDGARTWIHCDGYVHLASVFVRGKRPGYFCLIEAFIVKRVF